MAKSTSTVATPKASKGAKAAPAPKAAPKAAPAKAGKAGKAPAPAAPSNKIGKPARKVLEVLVKRSATRAEISAATGINSGFTSLLGHVEADRREPQSLAFRGLIKPERDDRDGKDVIVWVITAAGKKALEAARKAE